MKGSIRIISTVALACVATGPLAQIKPTQADSEASYDNAVARVWGQINSTRYAVDWCADNNRGSKSAVKKAYADWTTRFGPVIADINQRIDAVMNPGGAIPAREFAAKKAELLKRGAQRYADSLKAGDADQARRDCQALPEQFGTRAFDLEAKFVEELRLIRSRPLGAQPPAAH
ncbi:MAG TPA: hypothetical protein VFL16_08140 [Steroidobacteraceae bacterium]|nr:hypothetical protein [Steroidobacteraceae bacterium]